MSQQIFVKIPGNVWKILVSEGDKVEANDTLFILEVMKTEVPHDAEKSGIITSINIQEGDIVDAGIIAVEIS